MKLQAVFDISAFIWDEAHYKENKPEYYDLMSVLPNLYDEIIKHKIPLVFRSELIDEIYTHFPYSIIPNELRDFEVSTLSFISKVNMVEYPNVQNSNVTCQPSLIKEFYSHATQSEITHLISYLFSQNKIISKFLTLSIFWGDMKTLVLRNETEVEIPVAKCDDFEEHEKIIFSLKKIFDHNPKHNKYKSSNFSYFKRVISPLSCYNERFPDDKTDAQTLLDESVFYNGDFVNFDKKNNTYVMFVQTIDNIYHGFNIQPAEADELLIKLALSNG